MVLFSPFAFLLAPLPAFEVWRSGEQRVRRQFLWLCLKIVAVSDVAHCCFLALSRLLAIYEVAAPDPGRMLLLSLYVCEGRRGQNWRGISFGEREERRGKQFLTVGCLLLSSLATNNISIRWLNRLRRWRHRGNPTREWSSMCAFLHSRACSPLVHCVTLSTVACNVTRSGTNVTEERKRRRTVCLCQCRSVRCRAWQRRW